MTRKIETIPVRMTPHREDTNPCRVLGRIRNLVVCWHPEAVYASGALSTTYRARRSYCTVAVHDTAMRKYLPTVGGMLTQWQALRLAIVLAGEPVDWDSWCAAWREMDNRNDVRDLVNRWAACAHGMPDDQKKAEEKRRTLINWVAWYGRELRDEDLASRDKYYSQLLELEEFMGA